MKSLGSSLVLIIYDDLKKLTNGMLKYWSNSIKIIKSIYPYLFISIFINMINIKIFKIF